MDWIDKLINKWGYEEEEEKTKEKEQKTMLCLFADEIDAAFETDPFYLGW